jgi:hypothetical protein
MKIQSQIVPTAVKNAIEKHYGAFVSYFEQVKKNPIEGAELYYFDFRSGKGVSETAENDPYVLHFDGLELSANEAILDHLQAFFDIETE